MKILFESYSNVMQGFAGGVSMRISKLTKYLNSEGAEVKLFNKWEDKIEDYDIIHIFKVNIDNYSLISYAKSMKKKIVVSSIVPLENKARIILCRLLYKIVPVKTTYKIMNDILDMADVIIAQTSKEAGFIEKYYKISHKKIHIIPNGVNENIIDEYNQNYKSENKNTVLYVGRFDRNKNQLSLIRALKNSDIPIVFVGGSIPTEKDYYDKCLEEATPNMKFMGWLSNDSDQLMKLYSKAKVVTLLSHKEIFGNALIEGGAIGANLVVTKELPVKEWGIENNCITVNSHDVNEIRKAILKAYNKPVDLDLPKYIQEKFSWLSVAKEYISIYEKLYN